MEAWRERMIIKLTGHPIEVPETYPAFSGMSRKVAVVNDKTSFRRMKIRI